jgi:hypothetical protein
MVTWLFQDTPPLRVRLAIIGGISELLLLMLSALLGLAAAWLTLVFRPEIVGEKRSRRWISQICLILGICAGGYWLHRMGTPLHQQVWHHGLATLDAITRAADSRGSAPVVFTL